jgi:hypothetical protein
MPSLSSLPYCSMPRRVSRWVDKLKEKISPSRPPSPTPVTNHQPLSVQSKPTTTFLPITAQSQSKLSASGSNTVAALSQVTLSPSTLPSPGPVTNTRPIPSQSDPATTITPIPTQLDSKPSASGSNPLAAALAQLPTKDDPPSFSKSAWNGFIAALEVTKEVSGLFPPLRSAVGGFLEAIKVVNVSPKSRQSHNLC